MTYKPKQGQVFQLDIPDSGIAYVKVDKVVNKERWYWFPKKYYVLRYQPINRLSPSLYQSMMDTFLNITNIGLSG